MADAISVTRDGHRTFLKWHRARRRASDPVFTGRRILEGMALGASVEVDLVAPRRRRLRRAARPDARARDDRPRAGARDARPPRCATLRLRDNDGSPIADRVMLLEDLAALIARDGAHPEALLQLDYKEDAAALDPARHRHLRRGARRRWRGTSSCRPATPQSVRLLAAGVPGLRIGYDPCHRARSSG